MQVQILDGLERQQQELGLKFAKFLKRATGSHHMPEALLKTAIVGAAVGGTAYAANKKYHWWDSLKSQVGQMHTEQKVSADPEVNSNLLQQIIETFLPKPAIDAGPVNQSKVPTPPVKSAQPTNYLPLLLIGGAAIGALLFLRKR
jgi:H+/Cl- antiporter ClcA